MASTVGMSASWTVLSETMSSIRHRWRLRLALRGLTIVLGAALLFLVAGSWAIWLFHFNTLAIAVVRTVAYAALAVLVVRYVVLPLKRSASDNQVALYLEEHEPSLDAVVISAVETGTSEVPASARSPRLVARLVDMAAARVTAIRNGVQIETRSIKTSLLTILGILVAGALMLGMGPRFMRTGARILAAPGMNADVFIAVQPGTAQVSRGGDQEIRAQLHGFDASRAELVMQRGSGKWERLPMTVIRDSAAFVIRLFAIKERTTYYIDAGGMRSSTYYLNLVDLPFVKRLTLEYHYPAYTGLATRVVDRNGDIKAPERTSVIVRATTTMPVRGGRIVIAGRAPIPMALDSNGVLTGAIQVTAPGLYKIELEAPNGSFIPGSLAYIIEVIKDQKPTVIFLKPGSDVARTPTENLVTEVKATDDYGLAALEIRYAINGGAEHVVPLPLHPPRKQIVADYTLFLKRLALKPSDIVSYYAQVTDNDPTNGGKTAKSQLFFVRMVEKHEDEAIIKKPGAGGPQDNRRTFIEREREIIYDTHDVDRDRADMSADTLREQFTALTLAQRKLREDVDSLRQEINSRILSEPGTPPAYQIIFDELSKAVEMMESAENSLAMSNEHAAMSAELSALQHLQRAQDNVPDVNAGKKQNGGKNRKPTQLPPFDPLPPKIRGTPPNVSKGKGSVGTIRGEDIVDLEHIFDPSQDQLGQQYETVRKGLQQPTNSTSRPVLRDFNDVPPDFQALVSEYYRSLAKEQ